MPGNRVELRDLPARPDPGLLDLGCRLADALRQGLSGEELYCEVLLRGDADADYDPAYDGDFRPDALP